MKTYLDTNVFYNAYCPVENNDLADWILDQLTPTFQAITSEWTLLEMFRALKKQVNLGKIAEKEAKTTIDFFLSEISEMSVKNKLELIPVTQFMIIASKRRVFNDNLYAADALHATVAIISNVNSFITFDRDFKVNLGNILILNPQDPGFKDAFSFQG
ncbi:MAG: type II toxin-antitoxin system VapC family toxin [Candidatus Hodarchaeales archaeon]